MSPENVYIQVSGLKPGAFLKTIRVADREVTDQVDLGAAAGGLELLVSLAGATVQGAVKGSGPKPPAGATVELAEKAHVELQPELIPVSAMDGSTQ